MHAWTGRIWYALPQGEKNIWMKMNENTQRSPNSDKRDNHRKLYIPQFSPQIIYTMKNNEFHDFTILYVSTSVIKSV